MMVIEFNHYVLCPIQPHQNVSLASDAMRYAKFGAQKGRQPQVDLDVIAVITSAD